MSANVAAETEARETSLRYGWYIVLVLMCIYTLSFVDRQILSLLVGPIKKDLQISDTQFALLQGFAFAIFYTLMGIPLGRVADVGSRKNLIFFGVLVWSAMTALCAGARSFVSLFLCRIGVGVGEAALGPAAFSMLSDSFPKERLGLAVSVYTMGIFIGSGLALIVGGTVVQAASTMSDVTLPLLGTIPPWRLTFLIVGVPGILAALWVYSLREPLRRGLLRRADGAAVKLSLREVAVELGKRWGSFILLAAGMIFQSMTTFAFNAWTPAYFQRIHGWTAQQTGNVLGVMFLVSGIIGMLIGGVLTDRWKAKGRSDAPLIVLLISALGLGVFYVPAFLVQGQPWLAVALLTPALMFTAMPIGSAYSSAQLIFPNQVRGVMTALLMFLLNLGGISLGPLIPALLTDQYFHNEMAVGESLAITMGMTSIAMLILFGACRPLYRKDYEALHSGAAVPTS